MCCFDISVVSQDRTLSSDRTEVKFPPKLMAIRFALLELVMDNLPSADIVAVSELHTSEVGEM